MVLVKKTFQTHWETKKETVCVQLVEKLPKLDKKMRRKTESLINKKLLKLNEKMKRKIDHLLLCTLLCKR